MGSAQVWGRALRAKCPRVSRVEVKIPKSVSGAPPLPLAVEWGTGPALGSFRGGEGGAPEGEAPEGGVTGSPPRVCRSAGSCTTV